MQRALAGPRLALGAGRVLQRESKLRLQEMRLDRDLQKIAGSEGRVIAGPWLSEIGFEVLYWVPMLRWITRRHGIDPSRVVALSRGGAKPWYSDVAGDYLEILDWYTPEELRELHDRRVAEAGGQKQMGLTQADQEIIDRAREALGGEPVQILHPSLMYNSFRWFWSWRAPPKLIEDRVEFEPLERPVPAPGSPVAELQPGYVAVKAYFSSCFPESDETRGFVRDLVTRLARTTNVVMLDTGLRIDDHSDVDSGAAGGSIVSARDWMTPQDNLTVQTQIIAGADALFTTYGGFAYLGPFMGVPTTNFFSEVNFNATHLVLMQRALKHLPDARFLPMHIHDISLLEPLIRGGNPALR